MSFHASREAFARALKVIPGGVNSPVRAFRAVGGDPLFLARGAGAKVWDVDGNEYIDYVGSWGPLILGHAHPKVVAAVQEAAALGTSFGAPNLAELHLAELIVAAVPSVARVRLVNSGTEATMSALRLARAYTGRSKVIKFTGCYHGHVDSLLVQAGSGATTLGVPDSPGVTASVAADTLLAPYNDLAAVEALFSAFGQDIAAVIVEPIAGNMGLVLPEPGFLAGLRDVTSRYGALLIFDEVITGFRVAYGGAQELYGVLPDLTCLGKIIGGGMPIGAYGGRADIMEMVAPAGRVYQAGTLSGNPLAAAAGAATLELLKEEAVYRRLEEAGRFLADGLEQAARRAGIPVQVHQLGSCVTVFFTADRVVDYE
ncbi:MAG: glutamate-1-semialdehyde-2,1-aminomutase, partial [Firmicutes bacterium ZCTH02-B6]